MIPDAPKFEVCVFHVTALSVLVRSAPVLPPATHTPLPYATEQIVVVKFEVGVLQFIPPSVLLLINVTASAPPPPTTHTPFPNAMRLMLVLKDVRAFHVTPLSVLDRSAPLLAPEINQVPSPYATVVIVPAKPLVCVFHVTALFVLVRITPDPPPATHAPLPYATELIFVVKFEVCVFQVTPSFVLVRNAPPPPPATHTPFAYATELILDDPNSEVCVFHVTPLSVLVRSAPPPPAATHTPLPYATEMIPDVPKFDVCVLQNLVIDLLSIFLFLRYTLEPSSFTQPAPGDCTPILISPSSKKLFIGLGILLRCRTTEDLRESMKEHQRASAALLPHLPLPTRRCHRQPRR
jgi:hypothetical protein